MPSAASLPLQRLSSTRDQPQSPCSVGATARVFGLLELFEEIVLYLPVRDILLSMRVCKTFRDTITESAQIRQALFLEPLSEKRLERMAENEGNRDECGLPYVKILIHPLVEKIVGY